MTTVDHTVLIQRLVTELYNQRNLAAAEALFAPTIQLNGQLFSVVELQEAIAALPTLLPGFHVTLDVMNAAEDWVVTHWTIHRTATEPRHGMDASTEPASWTGLRLFRFADDKIAEVWCNAAARHRLEDLELRPQWGLPALDQV